jgi:hypothetical protein
MTNRLQTHAPFALGIIALLALLGTGCSRFLDDLRGEDNQDARIEVNGEGNTVNVNRDAPAPAPTPVPVATVLPEVTP